MALSDVLKKSLESLARDFSRGLREGDNYAPVQIQESLAQVKADAAAEVGRRLRAMLRAAAGRD
jgi:hypothetical protein